MDLENIVESLHVISVISWMCGMLYIPRLFVYHCETKIDSPSYQTFCIMERKLLKIIMNPAMISTFVFGTILSFLEHSFETGKWLHVKIVFVLCMSGFHAFFSYSVKKFKNNSNTVSHKYFRIINEVVAGIMCIIVFLVITKPF